MDNIIKELKLIINKELYQKKIISFEEFKFINDALIREKKHEYTSS